MSQALNPTAARSRWRKILYRLGITLGLGLLAYQAWQGTIAFRQAEACVARPAYFGVVIGVYIVAYLVQMAAWATIMRALGAPLRPQAVLAGYALAFLPRYIPGSVWGYLSRNEWLAQQHGVGYGISTTASLLEAALLLLTAGTLGGAYWLATAWQQPALVALIILAGLGGVAALWYIMPAVAARIMRHGDLPAHRAGFQWLVATILLYLCFWALQGAALVAIAQTLCGGSALMPVATIAASALAWATGFLIIFVPAGLGVREWTLGALLVTLAALPAGQATLLAVVSRVGLIAAEVLVLLIGLQTQLVTRVAHTDQA